MLKCFKVLSDKFRHTAYNPIGPDADSDAEDGLALDESRQRYKVCFGAVAVLCQYQLENGKPLYNSLVGDMWTNKDLEYYDL